MSQIDLAKLYKTQISLSEWFEKIGHSNVEALRLEDNEKRERLNVLGQRLGLPFDKPNKFSARAVAERRPKFVEFLADHGQELCALRLIPLDPKLPKLRLRGQTVEKVLDWFVEQTIDLDQYRAEFEPHAKETLWSTIFVVNQKGIFGEIISGGHYQLTQGVFDGHEPISFSFDFTNWYFSQPNSEAEQHVIEIVGRLKINNLGDQEFLRQELNSTFVNDYLCGYFETVYSEDFGLWFCDYNRLLGETLDNNFIVIKNEGEEIFGQTGCSGRVRGRVRVLSPENIFNNQFQDGEILVCSITTPE